VIHQKYLEISTKTKQNKKQKTKNKKQKKQKTKNKKQNESL
jgi:hypothetical protein